MLPNRAYTGAVHPSRVSLWQKLFLSSAAVSSESKFSISIQMLARWISCKEEGQEGKNEKKTEQRKKKKKTIKKRKMKRHHLLSVNDPGNFICYALKFSLIYSFILHKYHAYLSY